MSNRCDGWLVVALTVAVAFAVAFTIAQQPKFELTSRALKCERQPKVGG